MVSLMYWYNYKKALMASLEMVGSWVDEFASSAYVRGLDAN